MVEMIAKAAQGVTTSEGEAVNVGGVPPRALTYRSYSGPNYMGIKLLDKSNNLKGFIDLRIENVEAGKLERDQFTKSVTSLIGGVPSCGGYVAVVFGAVCA